MGSKGLIATDGTNVQRYDLPVIDYFEDINQNYFSQCFGQRFDTINQSWMLYPSVTVGDSTSDSILIYNFLENTWATYTIPLSCLGLYHVLSGKTWMQLTNTWESQQFGWDYYTDDILSPILLGGDQNGNVYQMDNGVSDNGAPIKANIVSTKWNPFIGLGQKVQFGYIDFYYEVTTVPTVVQLSFYTDNSETAATQRTFTMDGPTYATSWMKRIYINCMGEFLQMQIDPAQSSGFKIYGMVLWARPAGRLTP
jgi:hypothetical protein